MKSKWAPASTVLLLALAWPAHPQSKPASSTSPKSAASVEGRILCSDGNAPARGATVRLHLVSQILSEKPGPRAREERTDFNGYYRFPSAPPGVYLITVNYSGYNDNWSVADNLLDHFDPEEQKKILGSFPQVAVGGAGVYQQDVIIHRGGSISGHITMDSGGLPGDRHYELQARLIATTLFGDIPERDSSHYSLNLSFDATTDDRGYFRFAGLPPGQYKIQIHLWEGYGDDNFSGQGDLKVYAPEALDQSQAEILSLSDGEERTDADINVPTRLLHSITGTVTLAEQPIANSYIEVKRLGENNRFSGTQTNADGDFRLDLVPAGAYTLEAKFHAQKSASAPSKTARITVRVENNDITGANIELSAPAKSSPN